LTFPPPARTRTILNTAQQADHGAAPRTLKAPETDAHMQFADLGLSDELLRAVTEAGYSEPTPIQATAIPQVQMMRDLIAIAQTGTGKTASFVLPMIDILAEGRARARMPRSLILEPTRELAAQVAENFEKYGKYHKLSMALLIGGVQMGDQVKALEKGVDVLIATPGRLMDLFGRGKIMLNDCKLLVIDEADRMLDMGFIPDIEEICTKLPKDRQTLLFSATMPPPIKKLADKFLSNPKSIEVARPATANINIAQALIRVDERRKHGVVRRLLEEEATGPTIIFCNRKTMVRDLAKLLKKDGFRSGEIHGDMDQGSRIAELDRFKAGDIQVLVASDVAARGLDVKGVSHVINYDTPWHPDDYIHRIGRTGRAGATGRAYTLVSPKDDEAIANVQKLTGVKIDWDERFISVNRDVAAESAAPEAASDAPPAKTGRSRAKPGKAAPRAPAKAPKAIDTVLEPHSADVAVAEAEPVDALPEMASSSAPAKAAAAKRTPRPPRDAGKSDRPRHDAPRTDTRPPRYEQVDAEEDGAWNGPVPGFLGVGFGG
jgi:superfamily II DNA/RNA helicase